MADEDDEELMREAEAYYAGGNGDNEDDYYEYQEEPEEEEEEERPRPILPVVPLPPVTAAVAVPPAPIITTRAPRKPLSAAAAAAPNYRQHFTKQPVMGKKQFNVTLMSTGEAYYFGEHQGAVTAAAAPVSSSSSYAHRISADVFERIESDVELQIISAQEQQAFLLEAAAPEPPPPPPTRKRQQPAATASTPPPLVQRFSPARFVDLLSHEKKNRDALRWLKSWDPAQLKAAATATAAATSSSSSADPPQQGKYRAAFHPKILLLAGPAGTGKTTLAHVLARHCRYRVVEINASDDRNAQSLKNHLENVTETQSEVFELARNAAAAADDEDTAATARRALLVLDEVDGLLDGVSVLVQYANDKSKTRPIICTCNDAYAPALRPLRNLALVLTIHLPARARLVKRLREILIELGVRPVAGALELLCERMDDDIRASLNALDFWLHSSTTGTVNGAVKHELTRQDIFTLPAFAKDSTRDLWQMWRELLLFAPGSSSADKTAQHFFALDTDVVVDGVHENFTAVRVVDPSFAKTLQACDWMCTVDQLQHRTRQDMDFSFDQYLPLACRAVGKSLSNRDGGTMQLTRKFAYPAAARQHRHALQRNQDTVRALGGQLVRVPRDCVATLPHLLFPGDKIRPGIPHQHLLPAERAEMDRISSLALELGVEWKEDEPGRWCMDPPIGALAQYGGGEDAGGGNRQFDLSSADLARSLNAHAKKRLTDAGAASSKPKRARTTTAAATVEKDIKPSAAAAPPPPPVTAVGVRRDFFGRVLAVQPHQQQAAAASGKGTNNNNNKQPSSSYKSDFIFKFNEGFTDAVRRSLKMKDLLPE